MKHELIAKFDELFPHVDFEEHPLIDSFRKELQGFIKDAIDDAEWRCALEAGGVDNWCGYHHALSEAGYWADKMEDRYE